MAYPQRIKKLIPLSTARLEELALRYVSRYSATAGMLKKTLMRHVDKAAYQNPDFIKAPFVSAVESILSRFAQKGWIDDAGFAKRMVERASASGVSKNRLMQKLNSKGITGDALKAALSEGIDSESEWQAALNFAKKKFLGPWRKREDSDRNKEIGKLARAGFAFATASKIAHMATGEDVTS